MSKTEQAERKLANNWGGKGKRLIGKMGVDATEDEGARAVLSAWAERRFEWLQTKGIGA